MQHISSQNHSQMQAFLEPFFKRGEEMPKVVSDSAGFGLTCLTNHDESKPITSTIIDKLLDSSLILAEDWQRLPVRSR